MDEQRVKLTVDPDWIKAQRELGWPDMHPEDYCHQCGAANPLWFAGGSQWIRATETWAENTGRDLICCPKCFLDMYETAVGRKMIMQVTIIDL